MTRKRTHLTLYEATIDDTAEHVTIKQVPKAYRDVGFGGGSGPNFKELEARKLARKERVLSQIIANNDNDVNINFSQKQQQKDHDIDSDNGCSPLRKPKSFFLIKQQRKRLKNIQRAINGKIVTVSHPRGTVRQHNTFIVVLLLKMQNRKMKKETNVQIIKKRNAHLDLWLL